MTQETWMLLKINIESIEIMTIHDLILDYSHSLTRIEAERDLLKAIALKAQTECYIDSAAFKTAAMAYHKDQVAQAIDTLETQLGVLETIRDGRFVTVEIKHDT